MNAWNVFSLLKETKFWQINYEHWVDLQKHFCTCNRDAYDLHKANSMAYVQESGSKGSSLKDTDSWCIYMQKKRVLQKGLMIYSITKNINSWS